MPGSLTTNSKDGIDHIVVGHQITFCCPSPGIVRDFVITNPDGTIGHDAPSFSECTTFNVNQIGHYNIQVVEWHNPSSPVYCEIDFEVYDRATPTITSSYDIGDAVPVGTTVCDTFILSGGDPPYNNGGNVDATWSENQDCSGDPVHTPAWHWGVLGGAPPYTRCLTYDTAGIFLQEFNYAGNEYNKPVEYKCEEPLLVYPVPAIDIDITTEPSAESVYDGQPFTDTATLSGSSAHPTGSLTFELHGPGDGDCSGIPVASYSRPIDGYGTYPCPGSFTNPPGATGTYNWVVKYSGDTHTNATQSNCGDEPVEVLPLTTSTVTTDGGPDIQVGDLTQDSADLLDVDPLAGGTVDFALYGPDDLDCSGAPIYTESVPVSGPGSYQSTPLDTTGFTPGVYRWIANYSGDSSVGAAPTANGCNEASESFTVHAATVKGTPDFFTRALRTAILGQGIYDKARLQGGNSPLTGQIVFKLYAPGDPLCTGSPLATISVTVNGVDWYASSPLYTPTVPGLYHWVASYEGDWQNNAVSTGCGEPGESTLVTAPLRPRISFTAVYG